jgi:hypothetical protein
MWHEEVPLNSPLPTKRLLISKVDTRRWTPAAVMRFPPALPA